MEQVKVEIISDYICPWCYIGKARLEKLQLKLKDEIQLVIHLKPYILYPHIPLEGSPKTEFATKTKPGMGRSLKKEAAVEGVKINYKEINIIPSSREAHRLTWLIEDKAQAYHLARAIFHDYFEKGRDIGDKKYLITLAKSLDIDTSVIRKFQNASLGTNEVDQSIRQTREDFISVVPSLRLNDQFLVPGLQSMEVWENYIRRAAKKSAQPK